MALKLKMILAIAAIVFSCSVAFAGGDDGPGGMPGMTPPPSNVPCGCPRDTHIISHNTEYVGAVANVGSAQNIGEFDNNATGAGIFVQGLRPGLIAAFNDGYVRATFNGGSASMAPGSRVNNSACGSCVSHTKPKR
jgi:hypothetical protein